MEFNIGSTEMKISNWFILFITIGGFLWTPIWIIGGVLFVILVLIGLCIELFL